VPPMQKIGTKRGGKKSSKPKLQGRKARLIGSDTTGWARNQRWGVVLRETSKKPYQKRKRPMPEHERKGRKGRRHIGKRQGQVNGNMNEKREKHLAEGNQTRRPKLQPKRDRWSLKKTVY